MAVIEAPERFSLPKLEPEYVNELGNLFPQIHDWITGEATEPLNKIPSVYESDDFDPDVNPRIGRWVDEVADKTGKPREVVIGEISQIFALRLPKEVFGGKASTYATTGVIYANPEFGQELLKLDTDILFVHKPTGSKKLRILLDKFYRWVNVVAPKASDQGVDLTRIPLPLEKNVLSGAAYQEFIDTARNMGAFTPEQVSDWENNVAKHMRDMAKPQFRNLGRLIGEEFTLFFRQALQDDLRDYFRGIVQGVFVPIRDRGGHIYFPVTNYEMLRKDGKPLSITMWAGEHNPEGTAVVHINPLEELRSVGTLIDRNGIYYTPDGRFMVFGIEFLDQISADMRDEEAFQRTLKPVQRQIAIARRRGQHPIAILPITPYVGLIESFKLVESADTGQSWSNRTGAVTGEAVIGALDGLELVQSASFPGQRRDLSKNPIPADDYWYASHPNGALRLEGDTVDPTDTAVLHNPEGTISVGVAWDGHPISLRSRSLPPQTIEVPMKW